MRLTLARLKKTDLDHEKLWGGLFVFLFLFIQCLPSWFINQYPCLFRKITGLPCLSCGITRILLLLGQGEMAQAFRLSPLFTLAAVGAAGFVIYCFIAWIFGLKRIRISFDSRKEFLLLMTGLGMLLILNWVLSILRGV
jgi:hypothetical protein